MIKCPWMEYIVIRKTGIPGLHQQVRKKIEEGWKPHGGVAVCRERDPAPKWNDDEERTIVAYYQAMIREAHEQKT